MKRASRELLAAREDVWAFLAEPNHLADWWPGVVAVEADRRGFARDARWQVQVVEDQFGVLGLPTSGRLAGPGVEHTLVITGLADEAEWSWRLIPRTRTRVARTIGVSIALAVGAPDRTLVTIGVGGASLGASLFGSHDRRVARTAVNRLYDLVQTAATL